MAASISHPVTMSAIKPDTAAAAAAATAAAWPAPLLGSSSSVLDEPWTPLHASPGWLDTGPPLPPLTPSIKNIIGKVLVGNNENGDTSSAANGDSVARLLASYESAAEFAGLDNDLFSEDLVNPDLGPFEPPRGSYPLHPPATVPTLRLAPPPLPGSRRPAQVLARPVVPAAVPWRPDHITRSTTATTPPKPSVAHVLRPKRKRVATARASEQYSDETAEGSEASDDEDEDEDEDLDGLSSDVDDDSEADEDTAGSLHGAETVAAGGRKPAAKKSAAAKARSRADGGPRLRLLRGFVVDGPPLPPTPEELRLTAQLGRLVRDLEDSATHLGSLPPSERKRLRNRKASCISRVRKKLAELELQKQFDAQVSARVAAEQRATAAVRMADTVVARLRQYEPDFVPPKLEIPPK